MHLPFGKGILKTSTGILAHPLTLSLLVALPVILFLPAGLPKYLAKVEQSRQNGGIDVEYFADLENDGYSDKIGLGHNVAGFGAVTLYPRPRGRVMEWDFNGKLLIDRNNRFFAIGPPKRSATSMINVFTMRNDSVFLNIISDFVTQPPAWKEVFVSGVGKKNGVSDVDVVTPLVTDIDHDGNNELVFGLTSGFSVCPRAIFIYDYATGLLKRSMETGSWISGFLMADLNGDGKEEIVTTVYAPGNHEEQVVPYHDSIAWIMAFDHHLEPVFPPIGFNGRTSGAICFILPGADNRDRLFVAWNTPEHNNIGKLFYSVSPGGKRRFIGQIKKEMSINNMQIESFHTPQGDIPMMPLFNGEVIEIDTGWAHHHVVDLENPFSHLHQFDIEDDGENEIFLFSSVDRHLTIYRQGFRHPVTLSMPSEERSRTVISREEIKGRNPNIMISSGHFHFTISYGKNPFWPLRWVVWSAIWLAVFLFVLLIRKTQRMQIEKRLKTEKKITELQLKIVRNQMDPHFTMNAINAVIDAVNREEKDQARDNLLHFSKMYRSLVLSADKIKRSLREEIEFTENYLALEQFRFQYRFRYVIDVQPDVDLSVEVPKMVIQSPVENAVKHGLQKKGSAGEVRILIRKEEKNLVIEVTDNGVGRAATAESGTGGTGKGMEMMNQFFELYHRITGVKVHSMVDDLKDAEGKPAGTKVVIKIHSD